EGGADVEHSAQVGGGDPEGEVDALDQLPQVFLADPQGPSRQPVPGRPMRRIGPEQGPNREPVHLLDPAGAGFAAHRSPSRCPAPQRRGGRPRAVRECGPKPWKRTVTPGQRPGSGGGAIRRRTSYFPKNGKSRASSARLGRRPYSQTSNA